MSPSTAYHAIHETLSGMLDEPCGAAEIAAAMFAADMTYEAPAALSTHKEE